MRPKTYPEAKTYLISAGLWFRNMQYYDGWIVLTTAQEHYDKRNNNVNQGS